MNVTFERFNALGIVLDTEQLLLWQYVYGLMADPDANIVTHKGRRFVAIYKEAYYKRYPYFGDKSVQWFGAMLRAIVKIGLLVRLEDGSEYYCLGPVHYSLLGQREPAIEKIEKEVEVKSKKKQPISSIEDRKKAFLDSLKDYHADNKDKLGSGTMNAFYKYWTQQSQASKKLPYPHMKFEAEEFFSIGHRLATWVKNEKKYGQQADQVAPVARKGSV